MSRYDSYWHTLQAALTIHGPIAFVFASSYPITKWTSDTLTPVRLANAKINLNSIRDMIREEAQELAREQTKNEVNTETGVDRGRRCGTRDDQESYKRSFDGTTDAFVDAHKRQCTGRDTGNGPPST